MKKRYKKAYACVRRPGHNSGAWYYHVYRSRKKNSLMAGNHLLSEGSAASWGEAARRALTDVTRYREGWKKDG